jgi:hypothetical protein
MKDLLKEAYKSLVFSARINEKYMMMSQLRDDPAMVAHYQKQLEADQAALDRYAAFSSANAASL